MQRLSIKVRDDRGAVAVMVALLTVALVISAAIVVDFGLVRYDRQKSRSAADAAVAAGLQAGSKGTGDFYNSLGVCAAYEFLKANRRELGGLPAGICATPSGTQKCIPGNPANDVSYNATTTVGNKSFEVWIKAPYKTNDATTGGGAFPEESLARLTSDPGDNAKQGCDQLGIVIKESTTPGLGKLVHNAPLVTRVRSAGRVFTRAGSDAPAMLLLRRTGCTALQVGSTSFDNSTIRVYGAIAPNGRTQPGTIHADTNGKDTSGNPCTAPFSGKAANGIIAYAAPLASNPLLPDPAKPGQITFFAGVSGLTGVDSSDNVYSLNAVSGTTGTKIPVGSRDLVTRKPVDDRYLSGVKSAMSNAKAVFSSAPTGYNKTATCASNGTLTVPALTTADRLFVDCSNAKGPVLNASGTPTTIDAGTVFFNGTVTPTSAIRLPFAHHVYIKGSSSSALDVGNAGTFEMNSTGHLDATGTKCADAPSLTASKAALFVKSGAFGMSGSGLLRLCSTTVYMMSGQDDGCAPAPYTDINSARTPGKWCPSNSAGNGLLGTTGGNVDWTAPNKYDAMTTDAGDPITTQAGEWSDPNGQEDLALWDETWGAGSDYKFVGGGTFHIQGVFMVPNGEIQLSGIATFDLKNAQFVASNLALASANTKLNMSVDPNAAVTIPKFELGLVR